MKTELSSIRPFVRYAQHITINDRTRFVGQKAYDNRLFYVSSGSGKIIINSVELRLSAGDMIIWQSGLLYDITCQDGEMSLLGINFDFFDIKKELNMPIPPARSDFDISKVTENVIFTDLTEFNFPIIFRSFFAAEDILAKVLDEYRKAKIYSSDIISSLVKQLILSAARYNLGGGQGSTDPDKIIDYINKHCTENKSNLEIAELFGYHPNHLSTIVSKKTGMSLHKYILKCKIMRSVDLLQTTHMTLSEIAEVCGFGDYSSFLKTFKKVTGHSTKYFR